MGAPSALLTRGLVYPIVPPTPGTGDLAVTDDGDGTGSAVITSATSSTAVYYATWTGATGSVGSWTLLGTLAGNGTIPISTGAGFYLWRLDVGGAFADLVYQPITDSSGATATSPIYQCCYAVQTVIRSLDLDGITDVNVVDPRWIPRMLTGVDSASLPKVLIAPWDRESFPGILNNKDDIGLCVVVVFVDAQNQGIATNFNRNTMWRWRVLSAFRFQPLAGVAPAYCAYNCVPEPDVHINPEWFSKNYFVSALGLRFTTRTTRGLI